MPVTADINNYRVYVRDRKTRDAIVELTSLLPVLSPKPQMHRWFEVVDGRPVVVNDFGIGVPSPSPTVTVDELKELARSPASVLLRRRVPTSPPEMPPVPPVPAADNFRVFITTTRDTEDLCAREPRARTDALNWWHWREQGEYGTGMDAPWGLPVVSMDWVRGNVSLLPTHAPAAPAADPAPARTIDGEPVPLRTPVQCQVLVYPGHTDASWMDSKGIIASEGSTLWIEGVGLWEKSHAQFRFPPKKSVVEQRCERLAGLLLDLGTAKTNTEVSRWVRDNVVSIGDAYTVVLGEFPADE